MMKVVNIFEEGLKDVIGKVKGLFNKQARIEKKELKKINNEIEESKRSFTLALHECNYKQCNAFKVEIQNLISKYEGLMENDPMEERVKLMKSYCDWLGNFIREIESKMKTLQESFEIDDYLEEGLKDVFKGLLKPFAKMKRNKDIKSEKKKVEKAQQITMDILEQGNLEKCIEIKEQVEELIPQYKEFLNTLEDKEYGEIYSGYLNWLQNVALPRAKERISKLQESFELDDDYLEEGLFSKKTEVEIEIIYDDWEAHCSAYEVGVDDRCLKSISIDLPEKFHARNSDEEFKGDWSTELINFVKKATKKEFKEYKIKRYFIH